MTETIEQAAERIVSESNIPYDFSNELIKMAQWQSDRLYSEEELRKGLWELGDFLFNNCQNGIKEGDPEKYFDLVLKELNNNKKQSSQPNPHRITESQVFEIIDLWKLKLITFSRMVEILNEIAEGKHKERIEI